MLRITAQHVEHGIVLKLEGRLVGAWVDEADASWRAVARIPNSPPIALDICDVSAVDQAGRDLLMRMHRSGAAFVARGCAMRELVREIVEACEREAGANLSPVVGSGGER